MPGSIIRKFLPTKFTSRLTVLFLSLLCATTLFTVWSSFRSHKSIRHEGSKQRLEHSSRLILPSIVDVGDNSGLKKLYETFEQDPEKFLVDQKRPDGVVVTPGSLLIKAKERIPVYKTAKPKSKSKSKSKSKDRKDAPKVPCVINNITTIQCLRRGREVYMPFKFIKQYFEVYGELINDTKSPTAAPGSKKSGGKRTFHFKHSITPLWLPEAKYETTGEFMFFREYNVEDRSKVELVSGVHGVPVSNQWDKAGYIYPIQVAQYGLSHYSKSLTDKGLKEDRRTVLEDGTEGTAQWKVPTNSRVIYKRDNSTDRSVLYFNTSGSEAISLMVDEERIQSCLSFDVKFISEFANLSVVIEAKQGFYVLTYTSQDFYKKTGYDDMQYGIGRCNTSWCSVHRDIQTDFKKFLPHDKSFKTIKESLIIIKQLEVRGEGLLDNIAISQKCHKGHFKAASDWIMKNQDSNGGWPVVVQRKITRKPLILEPGWYSAMGQGQAISLLVRAYHIYKKPEYLEAAAHGLRVYQNLSQDHGVKAMFLDKYVWYEEYPTTPPLFVLNGFIYSLFGLYDLAQLGQGDAKVMAQQLYDAGMKSLKVMLPLFDSGIGTFYDLRHMTIPGMAPNRARGDYHAVHISQLLNLATMDSDPLFNDTAQRWIGYHHGKWAPHN